LEGHFTRQPIIVIQNGIVMKKIWRNLVGKTKKKTYFIIDSSKIEVYSGQSIQKYLKQLESDQIYSIALSSITPDFLKSREIDLTLSRSLLSATQEKSPFYFWISKSRIVDPIAYRLRITFVANKKITQYECPYANIDEIPLIWNYLKNNNESSRFKYGKGWFNNSKRFINYLSIREKQELKELAHPPLLKDIFWDFSENRCKEREKFVGSVSSYHTKIGKNWNPNKEISAPQELIIHYPYYSNGSNRTGKITLLNSVPWTTGDLLFAIHNKCVTKIRNQDNHFFEGLSYHQDNTKGIPTYFLNLGS